ncbi:MAG: anti-sigma factor [Gemmatimonadota bacterium]
MTDSSRHPMHELVEEYVLELLDEAERAEFETRLAVDPTLASNVAAAREALSALALSTPVALPAGLKQRVMAHAVAHPEPVAVEAKVLPMIPSRRSRAPLWLGAALAASLLVVFKLNHDLGQERQATATANAFAARTLDAVTQRDSMIARLTDPSVELVTLASTGDAKPAVKVYVDQKRRSAVLSVASLETAPAGQAYQLWFIVDGKPIPSVTFNPGADGRALVQDVTLPPGTVAATAVTREPEGGSQAPTSAVLFVGAVKAGK